MTTTVDELTRRVKAIDYAKMEALAKAAGCSRSLPTKLRYGDKRNPLQSTIEPLIRFFSGVDSGEIDLEQSLEKGVMVKAPRR